MAYPVHYICTGSCKGVATKDQWTAGARTCAAKSCEKYGQPLERHLYCEKCGEHFIAEPHKCGS